MIQNKIVTIVKDNQFDKEWTLFHPYDLPIHKNHSFKKVDVTDVIRYITFSNKVHLILTEPCLSSRIIREIEWANQCIQIHLICKNEEIVKKYSNLHFSTTEIDPSIDFNYIGIQGKYTGYFMISDRFVSIDDSIEKVYFEKIDVTEDYSFLKNVSRLVIVDETGKKDYSELLKLAQLENIECTYVVHIKNYNKEVFTFAKNNKLNLLVSHHTVDSVIFVNQDGTLSSFAQGKGGFFILYPIEDIAIYIGNTFQCDFFEDVVDTKKLQGKIYSCYRGNINRLHIIDKKIIKIDVPIQRMSDFVSETFDSSIVDSHNDYSAEAMQVEYQFTLIPPMIDSQYVESSIYNEIHELEKQWSDLQTLEISTIKECYDSFIDKDFGLIHFLETTPLFSKDLKNRVSTCSYNGYYSFIQTTIDEYKQYNSNLIEICRKIFESLNEQSSETKFDKFDNEIARYRQTMDEKNALIEQGIDVLSNKRNVEILEKKVQDLLQLKKRFKGNSSSRHENESSEFIKKCEEVCKHDKKEVNNDSISNIVKPKEENNLSKFKLFVDMYLYSIKNYFEKCLVVLDKLLLVHIPENYKVYDKDNERFIVIDTLNEFETTKDICKEFSLQCITREATHEL